MSSTERCDEIIRLIDQVLGGPPPRNDQAPPPPRRPDPFPIRRR